MHAGADNACSVEGRRTMIAISENDLLKQISARLPEMSKGHRAIAKYILENYDKAAFMTASRLGDAAGVSESTVVRFAGTVGFQGYPELQDALQELIHKKLTSVQRIEVTNDLLGDADILDTVLNSDIEKIHETLNIISREAFNNAVNAIIRSKKIYIIGMRGSATLANLIAYNFRLIFDHVTLVQTTSGSEVFEQLLRVSENDTVIAVSFPRYSKRIINAVEYAKSQHAFVVSLTDSEISPIAKCADSVLVAKSDMVSFVDSLAAPLSVINALIVAITKKKASELEGIFSKLENIWDEYDVYEKDGK